MRLGAWGLAVTSSLLASNASRGWRFNIARLKLEGLEPSGFSDIWLSILKASEARIDGQVWEVEAYEDKVALCEVEEQFQGCERRLPPEDSCAVLLVQSDFNTSSSGLKQPQ